MHIGILAELVMREDGHTRRDEVLLLLSYLFLYDVDSLLVCQAFVVLKDTDDIRVV